MKIFSIGDLHLSSAAPKPMSIFGSHWDGHWDKICSNWRSSVNSDDVVLIPGDISWAMQLEDAKADLDLIDQLPGRKIIIRGNHDYWWNSIMRVRRALPPSIHAIQNDSIDLGEYVVCGTRGWLCPEAQNFSANDMKIYLRETGRLKLSLENAAKHGKPIIVMMHYPPFSEKNEQSEFTQLIKQYNVTQVVYGHLHHCTPDNVFEICMDEVMYSLVACDYLGFRVKCIMQNSECRN